MPTTTTARTLPTQATVAESFECNCTLALPTFDRSGVIAKDVMLIEMEHKFRMKHIATTSKNSGFIYNVRIEGNDEKLCSAINHIM